MTVAQWTTGAILVLALAAQALVPARRLLIVLSAAGASVLAATWLGVSSAPRILQGVPWDVLVIVVSLGL